MTSRELELFKEAIKNPKIQEMLWDTMDEVESIVGNIDIEILDILDKGIESYEEDTLPMYIYDLKEGNKTIGYKLEYTGDDGEIYIDSTYYIKDEKIDASLVERVREMTKSGYTLIIHTIDEDEIMEMLKALQDI